MMEIGATKKTRVGIGIAVWTVLGTWAAIALVRDFSNESKGTARQVSRYVLAPRQKIELNFENPQVLRVAESIFERRGEEFVRIGEITATTSSLVNGTPTGLTQHAIAEIYSSAEPIGVNDRLTYVPATESMSWVIASMLTPERRERIGQLLFEAYQDHHQEIVENFRPIVEDSLREASAIILEDLRAVAPEYEPQWQALGDRYRDELVNRRLVPLLREEIWPLVVRESEPLVSQIGQEIWSRASFWRFGWRAMYDVLPLPERELTKREFERFVQSDAVPALQAHLQDLLALQQRIFIAIAQNPKVQSELAASLKHVMSDEEAQDLAGAVLQRVVTQNQRLNAALLEIWNSPRVQQAFETANYRLEYTISSIGEELFGNPHTAITPEFSRVLRYKVLHKDCQWLVLERGASAGQPARSLDVVIGDSTTANPFHVPAEKRN